MFQVGDIISLNGSKDWLLKVIGPQDLVTLFYRVKVIKGPPGYPENYETISVLSELSWSKINKGHPLTKIFKN